VPTKTNKNVPRQGREINIHEKIKTTTNKIDTIINILLGQNNKEAAKGAWRGVARVSGGLSGGVSGGASRVVRAIMTPTDETRPAQLSGPLAADVARELLLLGLLCSAPQALVAPACAQPGTCYESCHVVGVLRGVRVMRGVRVKPRLSVTCSQSCQGCVPASGNPCPPHATRGACGCQRGWRGERGSLVFEDLARRGADRCDDTDYL
jgi:hypothetical protein